MGSDPDDYSDVTSMRAMIDALDSRRAVLDTPHLVDRFTRLFEGPVEVTPPRRQRLLGPTEFWGHQTRDCIRTRATKRVSVHTLNQHVRRPAYAPVLCCESEEPRTQRLITP